jgi:hypothetical protein
MSKQSKQSEHVESLDSTLVPKTSDKLVDPLAVQAAIAFMLKLERPKHMVISLVGNAIDTHLAAIDPSTREAIAKARAADIAGRKADMERRRAQLEADAQLISELEQDTALLLTDGGSKPALEIGA